MDCYGGPVGDGSLVDFGVFSRRGLAFSRWFLGNGGEVGGEDVFGGDCGLKGSD